MECPGHRYLPRARRRVGDHGTGRRDTDHDLGGRDPSDLCPHLRTHVSGRRIRTLRWGEEARHRIGERAPRGARPCHSCDRHGLTQGDRQDRRGVDEHRGSSGGRIGQRHVGKRPKSPDRAVCSSIRARAAPGACGDRGPVRGDASCPRSGRTRRRRGRGGQVQVRGEEGQQDRLAGLHRQVTDLHVLDREQERQRRRAGGWRRTSSTAVDHSTFPHAAGRVGRGSRAAHAPRWSVPRPWSRTRP